MLRYKPTFLSALLVLSGLNPAADASPPERAVSIAGDVGFGAYGDRAYSTVQSGVDIREGNLTLGLFGRVRLTLQEAGGEHPAIRQRDWDEPGDFVHILRHVGYYRQFKTVRFSARAGELLGVTLGHGTLVRDFSNLGDLDHPHSGLRFRLDHDRFDLDLVVDNVIRPALVGGRLAVRPAASLPGLEVGVTGVVDPTAPLAVTVDEGGFRAVDAAWNLQSHTQAVGLLGLDVEVMFGSADDLSVTPYADLNTSFYGIGGHLGAVARAPLGDSGFRLGLQAEYRVGTGGYAATYMDTFYDIERHQAGLTFEDPAAARFEEQLPKQAVMVRELYGGHGALVQAALSHGDRLRAKVGYGSRPGPDAHSLWVRFDTRPVDALNIGALVLARGLGGEHDDANGLVVMAEARYRITPYLTAWLSTPAPGPSRKTPAPSASSRRSTSASAPTLMDNSRRFCRETRAPTAPCGSPATTPCSA